jgi:hypothetical protein
MFMYSYFLFMYLHLRQLAIFGYPNRGFSVLFPQLYGKCQSKTRKDGAGSALFQTFCGVLCIVGFVSFCVLFVCKCVLYYCHRVATQLQLTNISYHLVSTLPQQSKEKSHPRDPLCTCAAFYILQIMASC